jgi:hypothetical protein
MASNPASRTDPLRRIATLATRLPLVLLAAAMLSGCGTGEGFDEPDPGLQSDGGGALLSPQSAFPVGTSDTTDAIVGTAERPAPTAAVPVISGKPL